jgi:ankyrin repeat protein
VVRLLLHHEPADDADKREWVAWQNKADRFGSALHVAASGGHADCVQALVDAGADLHVKDDFNNPLLLTDLNLEVARILVDAGAADADMGDYAIFLACLDPTRIELLRLLLQRFPEGGGPYPHRYAERLTCAAEKRNTEAVRLLLVARPVDYLDPDRYSECIESLGCDDFETTRLLLERGADPRLRDDDGTTFLMNLKNASCLRMLLEAAPDLVNFTNIWERTALMYLCLDSSRYDVLVELFRCCEELGIDLMLNSRDGDGNTALHLAMSKHNIPAMKLLLEKGADVMGRGHHGNTVLMSAVVSYRYQDGWIVWISSPSYIIDTTKDTNTSASISALLDAILGGGERAATDPHESTEAHEGPVAKRRRVIKR